MTAGLAALPATKTNQGSALSNVARQTSAALGLAVLNALSTGQQAQLLADRSALLPAADAPPSDAEGIRRLYGHYRELAAQVLATSYANVFLVIAVITGAGALLALFLRKPGVEAAPGAAASMH
ncbi:hypothetical protein BKA01_004135 [Pseudonocardia eucalypti]|nr:hypothetical protein [Pseudonocardia eucalypti]